MPRELQINLSNIYMYSSEVKRGAEKDQYMTYEPINPPINLRFNQPVHLSIYLPTSLKKRRGKGKTQMEKKGKKTGVM